MKVINHTLTDFKIDYPLEQFLFLDIETTGFAAKSSSL